VKTYAKVAASVVALAAAVGAAFALGGGWAPTRSPSFLRSVSGATKLWPAGNFLCVRDAEGIQCIAPGSGRDPVDNVVRVPFLADPEAFSSHGETCALDGGAVWCWDMRGPLFAGLGLVYTPEQQARGVVFHGAVSARTLHRLKLVGRARGLVAHQASSLLCVLDDEGMRCFGDDGAQPLSTQPAQAIFASTDGALVCATASDVVSCYGVDLDAPRAPGAVPAFAPLLRIQPAADTVAVAANFDAVCALGPAGVACAPRSSRCDGGAAEDLHLHPVPGLGKPSRIWSRWDAFLAQDGDRIMKWDPRRDPTPRAWTTLSTGEEAYVDGACWFLWRSGRLTRDPDSTNVASYELPERPTQLARANLSTVALVGGRVARLDD
jgi:hypothetical protein